MLNNDSVGKASPTETTFLPKGEQENSQGRCPWLSYRGPSGQAAATAAYPQRTPRGPLAACPMCHDSSPQSAS